MYNNNKSKKKKKKKTSTTKTCFLEKLFKVNVKGLLCANVSVSVNVSPSIVLYICVGAEEVDALGFRGAIHIYHGHRWRSVPPMMSIILLF